ncbi:MAG: hypothetical protein ACO1SX_05665, partial [Actinomycetota bacterium]
MRRYAAQTSPPVAGLLVGLLGVAVMAAPAANSPARSPMGPVELHCEYQENPLAVDVPRPRLGWRFGLRQPDRSRAPEEPRAVTATKNAGQSAYQILVASSAGQLKKNRGDLWDSGRVSSSEQFGIEYAGKPLVSGQQAFWKVRAWERRGEV